MAKNMQPIAKRCKALGISPAEMGYAKKTTNRNPGGQMRKKKSEYGLQLAEKQKVKFIYTSLIMVTSRPTACSARIAASRPWPGPLTKTSTVFRPCSIAARAAVSAAV